MHKRFATLIARVPGILIMLMLGSRLEAQRTTATHDANALHIEDSLHNARRASVSPHVVVFDEKTQSATITFINTGSKSTEADVVIELGYAAWQNRDTALFSHHWQRETPYDTVVANPRVQDHYAGRWLSGVPTHLVLQPHERKQVILRVTPPAGLPDGEYYARIVTIVRPKRQHTPTLQKDTKTIYTLPVHGVVTVPPVRDSVRVYYRQGPQTMGMTVEGRGAIDTTREGNDSAYARNVGHNPLRNLVRVHLTGTAHFEGYEEVYYLAANGTRMPLTADISEGGLGLIMHTDGILRDLAQTDKLSPGHYTLVIRFIGRQDEFPPAQRIPMKPVEVSIPFDIN